MMNRKWLLALLLLPVLAYPQNALQLIQALRDRTAALETNQVDPADFDAAGTAASAVAAHEAAGNPHPTYLTQAEGDALYTGPSGVAAAIAAHEAASDPHPGYLTATEGNAAYDVSGAAAAAQAASQPLDADLTSIAALTTTSAGRALLDDADAAAQRSTLGLGNVDNTSDAGKPVSTAQQTALDAKQATLVSATNIKTINGSSVLGSGDLVVTGSGDGLGSDGDKGDVVVGGTGTTLLFDSGIVTAAAKTVLDDSSTANMLTTLGAQPVDAELTAVAGLTSATDRLPYFTGSGTAALATYTAAGRALDDDADAAAQRTTLGAAASGAVTASGLTQTTARLLGRTTASTGAIEEITVGSGLTLSAGSLTATGGSSPTGVFSDLQMSILQSDGTLNAASGVQTWAGTNKTAQDVFTVTANTTYRIRGRWIVNTGATTHTTAMAFALTTATATDFQYLVNLWSAAANTISTTQSTTHVTGVASKVLNATSTAVYTLIEFEGILVIGTGGTITPQINFSANPTGTNLMKRGSWVSFEKLGADTVTVLGGWN